MNPGHEHKLKPEIVMDWRSKETWQLNAALNPEWDARIELVIGEQIQIKSIV